MSSSLTGCGMAYVFVVLYFIYNAAAQSGGGGRRCYYGDTGESVKTGANDVIVVTQRDGSLTATELNVRVGKFYNWKTLMKTRQGKTAKAKKSY